MAKKTNKRSSALTTLRKLEKEYERAAKLANKKLEELTTSGLRNYNMQMSRKWNVMLADKNVKFVDVKKGTFRSKQSSGIGKWMSVKELKSAIGTLTQFSSSRYTSVEYTQAYKEELSSRLGIDDDRMLSEIFRIFREFGFEGRYDSSTVLSNIAEFMDRTGRDDLANILDRFIDDYNSQMSADTPPVDTDILANKISDLVANIDNGYEEDQILSGAELEEIERLREMIDSSETEPELVDEPVMWDNL